MHTGDRFGDDIEVLRGVQRHRDLVALAERARPLPRAVHEDLAVDFAAAGLHTGHETVLRVQLRNADTFLDLYAEVARALGKALRQIGRIRLAVGRKPERALQVVDAQDRPLLERFARREKLDLDAEAARHRGLALEHDPALRRARDVHAAALLPAGREPGFLLERRIEADAVLAHARHRTVGAHLPDEPGGMPGGAAGELALLEQHDVAHAELGEVVGDARPDNAAARDDDAGLHILSAMTPAATVAAPITRRAMCPSLRSQAPINAAKITEVSRSAATAATGARVIAQSTTP